MFRITDGLRDKYGEDRVFDTPVAESGIVGAAFGMAIAGMHPVAELQFLGFSYPAYDQIINHVARIRNRSNQRFTAPLVIRVPFGGGSAPPSIIPSRPRRSTPTSRASKSWFRRRLPTRGLLLSMKVPTRCCSSSRSASIGRSRRKYPSCTTQPRSAPPCGKRGEDITLVSWGAMMKETRAAATHLEESGHR